MFADREQRESKGYLWATCKHSKTVSNNSARIFSSSRRPVQPQKRHPVRGASRNGGAAIFDGLSVLRTPGGDAQFPVYQAINRQKTGI